MNAEKTKSQPIALSLTLEELQAVAETVGLSSGEHLLAMLIRPGALANVNDYISCVTSCRSLFQDNTGALVECIKGCAAVSKPGGNNVFSQ